MKSKRIASLHHNTKSSVQQSFWKCLRWRLMARPCLYIYGFRCTLNYDIANWCVQYLVCDPFTFPRWKCDLTVGSRIKKWSFKCGRIAELLSDPALFRNTDTTLTHWQHLCCAHIALFSVSVCFYWWKRCLFTSLRFQIPTLWIWSNRRSPCSSET